MRNSRIPAAAAAAVLAGLALLGSAPSASATVSSTPAPAAKAPAKCPATASLTGLSGAKLTVGGAPVNAQVTFTNVSGKKIADVIEMMALGLETADDPSSALLVEAKDPRTGKWSKLAYNEDSLFFRLGEDWPAGSKDSFSLRVSAPAKTPTGTYIGAAFVGSLSDANAQSSDSDSPMKPGNYCEDGIYTSAASFTVVKAATTTPTSSTSAAPKPSASRTGSGTPTATTSVAPSASGSSHVPASPSSSDSASAAVTPPVSASPTGPALAVTGGGSDTGLLAGAAGVLLAAGGAAVVVTRRRRGGSHS